jgi:hypothetical protein
MTGPAEKIMKELAEEAKEHCTQAGDPIELLELKSDIIGRMLKALDGKERFDRWGKHYLRALMRAHQMQVCTNFLDAGL